MDIVDIDITNMICVPASHIINKNPGMRGISLREEASLSKEDMFSFRDHPEYIYRISNIFYIAI